MSLDSWEATANTCLGALASYALVLAMRAAGLWDSLPAWGVVAAFFVASWCRSRAVRWWFRRTEVRHG